jgi:hypothetical protein
MLTRSNIEAARTKSKVTVAQVKKIVCWLVIILFAWSCDQSGETDTRQYGLDFFPLEVGRYSIYSSEEIRYALSEPETIRYDLKVVATESFANDEGGETFVLHRYRRSDGGEWMPDETWSAFVRQNQAIVSQGNVPYVVLEFPLEEGMRWNGNAYNTARKFYTGTDTDEYLVTSVNETVQLGEQTYSDCVVVLQEDEEDDILYKDFRREVYARDIGLIRKETTQLKYCSRDECLGDKIVEDGFILSQSLIEHGQE